MATLIPPHFYHHSKKFLLINYEFLLCILLSHIIKKNPERAKVATGKTFTLRTASPNKQVDYITPIVTRGFGFFDTEQYYLFTCHTFFFWGLHVSGVGGGVLLSWLGIFLFVDAR